MSKKCIAAAMLLLFWQNTCLAVCGFDEFFRENYEKLSQNLYISGERREFFDILFNAYSIKFQGLDFEYGARAEELSRLKEEGSAKKCIRDKKKEIRELAEVAMEEYDSFLEDLNFEICGSEKSESAAIKRGRRRYRRPLKKLITKNCKII